MLRLLHMPNVNMCFIEYLLKHSASVKAELNYDHTKVTWIFLAILLANLCIGFEMPNVNCNVKSEFIYFSETCIQKLDTSFQLQHASSGKV
jgi:hypothetical protein